MYLEISVLFIFLHVVKVLNLTVKFYTKPIVKMYFKIEKIVNVKHKVVIVWCFIAKPDSKF